MEEIHTEGMRRSIVHAMEKKSERIAKARRRLCKMRTKATYDVAMRAKLVKESRQLVDLREDLNRSSKKLEIVESIEAWREVIGATMFFVSLSNTLEKNLERIRSWTERNPFTYLTDYNMRVVKEYARNLLNVWRADAPVRMAKFYDAFGKDFHIPIIEKMERIVACDFPMGKWPVIELDDEDIDETMKELETMMGIVMITNVTELEPPQKAIYLYNEETETLTVQEKESLVSSQWKVLFLG